MATYIPGTKSYMPQFQPFTPDYKFLSAVLETKTNRYNTNYQQINDIYSKIVYAPLSRQDTQGMREQFASGLSNKLEKISGMDLSLVQNADAAKGIFKPFFEEDIIVADMIRTKAYQREMSLANSLANNPDPDVRDDWWQPGIDAMNFQMQDFINASKEDALNMPVPTYVPDANLYKLATEAINAQGYDAKIDVMSPDGQWIIRKENGDLVTGEALEMVQRTLYNDPRVQRAYYTQSYVDGRKAAQGMMDSGAVKSIDEGQRTWALRQIEKYTTKAAAESQVKKNELAEAENSNASWEMFKKSRGIIPGSKLERQMREQFALTETIRTQIENNNNIISEGVMPTNPSSTQDLLNRAHNMSMQFNIKNDMIAAVRNWGKTHGSVLMHKENPAYARAMDQNFKLYLEDIRDRNARARMRLKASLDNKAKLSEGLLSNLFLNFDAVPGGVTNISIVKDEEGDPDILKHNNQVVDVRNNEILGNKISAISAYLPFFQPSGDSDNMYSLKINGEIKTLPGGPANVPGTLANYLSQKDADGNYIYEDDINTIYLTQKEYILPTNDANNDRLRSDYPMFAASDKYLEAKGTFSNIERDDLQLKLGVQKMGDHQYDMFMKIIQTDFFDDKERFEEFTSRPSDDETLRDGQGNVSADIFYETYQGDDGKTHYRRLSQDEMVNKYINLARDGKLSDPDNKYGWLESMFRDPDRKRDLYMKPKRTLVNANTYDQIVVSGGLAGQTYTGGGSYYVDVDETGPDGVGPPDGIVDYEFDEMAAKKDALELYKMAYKALNKAEGTTLVADIEEVYSEGGDKTEIKGNLDEGFSTFNMSAYLRGDNPVGSVEDMMIAPTTKKTIIPDVINQDINGAGLIYDIATQLSVTPPQSYTVQPGNFALDNEEANLDGASDKTAMALLNRWLAHMQSASVNEDTPAANKPITDIYYNSVYGDAEDLKKAHASYIIDFPDDWVKKNLPLVKTTGDDANMTTSEFEKYGEITFAFRQEEDISVRRKGQYNYDNVEAMINNSQNKQYTYSADGGGSLSVQRNATGDYIAQVTLETYDPRTNQNVALPTEQFNLTEYILQKGGSVESHLETATKYFQKTIDDQVKLNNTAYDSDAAVKGNKE